MTDAPRSYRFAPRDRTGWLLGLDGTQCVVLASGLLLAALLSSRAGAVPALAVIAVAVAGAFASIRGHRVHRAAPVWLRFLTRRGPHFAPLDTHTARSPRWPRFPGPMARAAISAGPVLSWTGINQPVALVRGRDDATLTAVVRVSGRGFLLCERADQERLLQAWGEVLAGFCRERCSVVRLAWSEWSAPARVADDAQPGALDYAELVAAIDRRATRHEVLVAVTVARRRGGLRGERLSETLAEELRLLTGRLEDAGLNVDPPLGVPDLLRAIHRRCDPTAAPSRIGPAAVVASWRHVVVDAALHATWWVAEWPRADLPPNWLEPLLLAPLGPRIFTIVCTPVAPSVSRRQVERDTTRLVTDEDQRARHGFRVGLRQRRSREAVGEREAELVAGYAEVGFTGILTVSANDVATLEQRAGDLEQAAAQVGMELVRLDGRHDLALAAALPLGRGVGARSTR